MKTPHSELNVEKFIIFTVADYRFALPIAEVVQIVNRPATTPELSKAGLVQIGRHLIQVVNLHQQLAPENSPESAEWYPFLVITYHSSEGFYAIPVREPPNVIEFPQESMQGLPLSHDRSSVLSIASHAATLDIDRVPATIFLMDVNRLFPSRFEMSDRQLQAQSSERSGTIE
ncbi:chemotaxis protein CheW [Leptolyngbya sp. AN03gr2]